MSDFKDVTTEVRNTSQNTSFRATQYVRLLSGQCRDVSVPFSSFNLNFGGWYTFRATVDSDNKIMEQNESDNAFETNVQITKIQY
jgi:subtilase family serine protease